jgi:DNA-binding IclR family transcriptional regulator
MLSEVSMSRDKYQSRKWEENHAKILEVLKDFKPRTVIELKKIVKITRQRIYAHLHEMRLVGMVSREGSEFRLVRPIERFDNRALLIALRRIPSPNRLELVMSDTDQCHSITIQQEGEPLRYLRVLEHFSGSATIEIEGFPASNKRPESRLA